MSDVETNDQLDEDLTTTTETGDETPVSMEDTIRNRLNELRAGEKNESGQQSSINKPVDTKTTGTGNTNETVTQVSQDPNALQTTAKQDYPQTWRKGKEALWAAAPPELREEVLKREDDMRNGIAQYKQADTYAKTLYEKFNPYRAIMAQANVKDDQVLEEMLKSSYNLAAGTPEQKTMEIVRLCQQNGINFDHVIASFGNLKAGKDAVDPSVLRLQNELNQLKNQQQQFTTAQQQAVFSQANAQIAEFEKTNPFINEPGVRDHMALLLESGQAKDLQDAYDKSTWALPETRAKLTAQQLKAEQDKAAEKAAAAKKAASANVKTSGKHSGAKVTKGATMEDTIRAKLREINERGE